MVSSADTVWLSFSASCNVQSSCGQFSPVDQRLAGHFEVVLLGLVWFEEDVHLDGLQRKQCSEPVVRLYVDALRKRLHLFGVCNEQAPNCDKGSDPRWGNIAIFLRSSPHALWQAMSDWRSFLVLGSSGSWFRWNQEIVDHCTGIIFCQNTSLRGDSPQEDPRIQISAAEWTCWSVALCSSPSRKSCSAPGRCC